MNANSRDKAIKSADTTDSLDKTAYVLLLIWSVGPWITAGPTSYDPGYWPAVGFILAGLIRIRMLVRAIRVDALVRESEKAPNG